MEERIKQFLQISHGYSDGDGDGYGSGDGYGYGYGDGSGEGGVDGILYFNKNRVYEVDDIQTIIKSVRGNIAKGFILNKDLTLTPCYIAKSGNYFAHGKTLKKAVADAAAKRINNMPIEEKIAEFKKEFETGVKYSGHKFFDWHGRLTQSCEMGRESVCSNKGIDLDDMFTVAEFIEITKNEYGSDVIKKLVEHY